VVKLLRITLCSKRLFCRGFVSELFFRPAAQLGTINFLDIFIGQGVAPVLITELFKSGDLLHNHNNPDDRAVGIENLYGR
jgi:hypothetical protein